MSEMLSKTLNRLMKFTKEIQNSLRQGTSNVTEDVTLISRPSTTVI